MNIFPSESQKKKEKKKVKALQMHQVLRIHKVQQPAQSGIAKSNFALSLCEKADDDRLLFTTLLQMPCMQANKFVQSNLQNQ